MRQLTAVFTRYGKRRRIRVDDIFQRRYRAVTGRLFITMERMVDWSGHRSPEPVGIVWRNGTWTHQHFLNLSRNWRSGVVCGSGDVWPAPMLRQTIL